MNKERMSRPLPTLEVDLREGRGKRLSRKSYPSDELGKKLITSNSYLAGEKDVEHIESQ